MRALVHLAIFTQQAASFATHPKRWESSQHTHKHAASGQRRGQHRPGRDIPDIKRDVERAREEAAAEAYLEPETSERRSANALPNLITGAAPTFPGQEWGLLSIRSAWIHESYDQDWWPEGEADPYLWITIDGRFYESVYSSDYHNTNSPSFDLHLYIPPSGTAKIELFDDDSTTGDDLIFSVTVDMSSAGSFTKRVTQQECSWSTCGSRWWNRYPCRKCSDVVTGTLSGAVFTGAAAVQAEVQRLSDSGVELTEAYSSLLDGSDLTSYWQSAQYYVQNLGYLIRGNVGDDAGNPASGILKTVAGYSNECFAGYACTGGLKAGPGAGTTSIVTHAFAMEALNTFCAGLARLDRYRRNELGIQFFNGVIWPEKPSHSIGLGDSLSDHARARPLLDKMVGPAFAMSAETRRAIADSAAEFWAQPSPDTASVASWNIVLLHKFHLGLDVTAAFADEFVSNQLGYLAIASQPESTSCVAGAVVSGWNCDYLLKYKADRIAQYKLAIAAKFPGDWAALPNELAKTKLASQVLDSLLFAGGLSIPTVIRFAFATLYGEYGISQLGSDFVLTESLVTRFVMETVRRFPPVAGFPSWDRQSNQHVIIDLLVSQLDTTSGWGETAQDFKLRSLAEYHSKHIGWANQAIEKDADGNELNGHPNSRACPAKDLSIIMVSEFLSAFLRAGGQRCWTPDKAPADITVNGYSASTISFTETLECAATRRDAALTAQQLLGFDAGESVEFKQRVYDSVVYDGRFDLYTRVFALALAQNYDDPPYTAADVTPPEERQDVPDIPCGLSGYWVPAEDEHMEDLSRLNGVVNLANAALDFPETADECGAWRPGENPEQVVRDALGVWPSTRVLNPLGANRYSDEALEDAIFSGIGQHKVRMVAAADSRVASLSPRPAYVVDLSFAEALETRPGFAKLGAAAYFSSAKRIVGIYRNGKLYTPDGPQGTSRECGEYFSWGYWYPRCGDTWEDGWLHAKMAFRGTLVTIITVSDHLQSVHLTYGNALATANVEELHPDHPLRRLLTPFAFRTEAINYNAANILTPEMTLVHRAVGLSKDGIVAAFQHGNASAEMQRFHTFPELLAARGVQDLSLPLDEDGAGFYTILKAAVHDYISHYYDYASNACATDPLSAHGSAVSGIPRWYEKVRLSLPGQQLPSLTCENLEEVLATLLYQVTAFHRHTGTIAAETSDPCWAPSAWIDGYLCGLPRTAFTQSFIMATTGLEQPKLIEDYGHIFNEAFGKSWWASLTTSLTAFERVIEGRNAQRKQPYLIFLPSKIETAVGI